MKLIKKLTLKDCGIDMKVLLMAKVAPAAQTGKDANGLPIMAPVGPDVPLLRIVGICTGVKEGSKLMPDGKLSEWLRFQGQFKGANMITGEVFSSGECIMPGALPQLLAGLMMGDDAPASADFGVEISARYKQDAITQYEYSTRTLIEPKQSQAMLALESRIIGESAPAPAPAPAPVIVDTPPQAAPKGKGGAK